MPRRPKFSLQYLLVFTTLIAILVAVAVAFRRHRELKSRHDALMSLSSQLNVTDGERLQQVALPRIASDFQSWLVYVPAQPGFDLRLAVGDVSEAGVEAGFDSISLSAGRHRITLHAVDGTESGYHFAVYVDGQPAMERSLSRDYLPSGWSQASGLSWPRTLATAESTAMQLAAKNYTPRIDFASKSHFNGSVDEWVTQPGYRLWIDRAGATYPSPSEFMGFPGEPSYQGIGLRNGVRYRPTRSNQYEWTFSRPASRSRQPVLTIIPEFLTGKQTVLSGQTNGFEGWRLRDDATSQKALEWKQNDDTPVYSAFLHAKVPLSERELVVELRWDARRPDQVGFRLPDVATNHGLTRWRLRIVGGTEHLWRQMEWKQGQIESQTELTDLPNEASDPREIQFDASDSAEVQLSWQTDVAEPLKFFSRARAEPNPYAGLRLYEGLPLRFEATLPSAASPALLMMFNSQPSDLENSEFPVGPVIDEIRLELDGKNEDWLWLGIEPR